MSLFFEFRIVKIPVFRNMFLINFDLSEFVSRVFLTFS